MTAQITPLGEAHAHYALLRIQGEVMMDCSSEPVIRHMRTMAKKDGLQIVASRGSAKHLSRSQARVRPYTVALVDPSDPTTIVRPGPKEGS